MKRKKNISAGKALAGAAKLRKEMGLDRRDDEGFSAREYAEKFGMMFNAARLQLYRMVEQGKLMRGTALRVDPAGRKRPMTVFRPA